MTESYKKWDGNDWQKYISILLNLRYSPGQYQPIPDRDGGDSGLEGFASDGTAYQCYAAEEPLSVDELTDKQRDKITRDTNKLAQNQSTLASMLGNIKISCWILIVPRFDSKKILIHAETKSAEIRNKKLPILTPDFRIAVQDDSLFGAQRTALLKEVMSKLPVPVAKVPKQEIDVWAAANTELADTLETKLSKLNRPTGLLAPLKGQFIKHFLEGQNALQYIHANYPQLEESILSCKESKEGILATESLLSSALPSFRLSEILQEYRTCLQNDVAGLPRQVADILTYEAVADWLLRCPLDFYE